MNVVDQDDGRALYERDNARGAPWELLPECVRRDYIALARERAAQFDRLVGPI